MDIGLILRALGVGLCVAIAVQILNKSGRDDQAMLVSIAGIITALVCLVGEIGTLFDTVRDIFGLIAVR